MSPTSFELSMEQQFEVCRLQHEAQNMSREQALELLLQISQLLMVKDNVIRDLMKKAAF